MWAPTFSSSRISAIDRLLHRFTLSCTTFKEVLYAALGLWRVRAPRFSRGRGGCYCCSPEMCESLDETMMGLGFSRHHLPRELSVPQGQAILRHASPQKKEKRQC